MKSHFGNVEIRSIAQATSINEEGLYYVGNIENYSKDFKVCNVHLHVYASNCVKAEAHNSYYIIEGLLETHIMISYIIEQCSKCSLRCSKLTFIHDKPTWPKKENTEYYEPVLVYFSPK